MLFYVFIFFYDFFMTFLHLFLLFYANYNNKNYINTEQTLHFPIQANGNTKLLIYIFSVNSSIENVMIVLLAINIYSL